MSTQPLQIQKLEQTEGAIPALSQSKQADMACTALYVARHIEGRRFDSEPARRGTEVHLAIAAYVEHLVATRRKTDYEKLAELAAACGEEAREILQRFGESFFIDPETVVGTEIYIAAVWDERGIYPVASREDMEKFRGNVIEGTLDLVTLESPTSARIDDWKSFYQIVDADTFQSKLYPLLLFALNPRIEKVRFVLSFVRYGDAQRDVTYTRADVPMLMRLAERERARQLELHTEFIGGTRPRGVELKATPGRHCTWCPLLATGECPVARTNPYSTMKAEERVAFAIWISAAKKENDRVLKSLMVEGGPIEYTDANGTAYLAEFTGVVKRFFPLFERHGSGLVGAVDILMAWFKRHPEDEDFIEKLSVSGLSSPLKAKKRAELAEQLARVAEERAETKIRIAAVEDEDVTGDS